MWVVIKPGWVMQQRSTAIILEYLGAGLPPQNVAIGDLLRAYRPTDVKFTSHHRHNAMQVLIKPRASGA